MKKFFSLTLAGLLMLACFTACGGSGPSGAAPENSFTWWLSVGEDIGYYGEYENNPSWLHHLQQEWAGAKLAIDFSVAPVGAEQDNFNQMLATGEYLDIINMGTQVSQTAYDLYTEGVILDLTELIQQHMPNYWNTIQTVPAVAEVAWTEVDGEMKLLQIYGYQDAPQENFQGFMYRRDWVAKYGANPSTGEAFTGGLTDANDKYSWQDNVLFPSWYALTYQDGKLRENAETKAFVEQYKADYPGYDGTYPITISDWEWMFEIFDKAHADLGIDNYHMSLYYPGYNGLGSLNSCFGGGAPWWYNDNGTVKYGGVQDSMKAYIQCMQSWYQKGWLDQEFDTRSDMFYQIDTPATYQGKVGMWIGVQAQTGAQMDSGEGYTQGIMVYGCPYPVNDIYGGGEQKYVIPNSYYAYSPISGSISLTTAIQNKNLPALLTMLDALYSQEGARIKLGLTKEQAEALGHEEFLSFQPNGSYYTEERDGETWFVMTEEAIANRDADTAMKPIRTPVGLEMYSHLDRGFDRYTRMTVDFWDLYPTSAVISDPMKAKLTPAEQKNRGKIENNITTYMNQTVPKFIKGQLDVNSSDWDDFCTTQNKYGVQKMIDIYQSKYDAMK